MSAPVQITPQSVANAIDDLLAENEALRAELAAYVPYVKQSADNRPKLSKREAKTIRRMHREGWTQAGLAEIYDVNPATISRIVRGHYWK